VCFFAHTEEELRTPAENYTVLARATAAASPGAPPAVFPIIKASRRAPTTLPAAACAPLDGLAPPPQLRLSGSRSSFDASSSTASFLELPPAGGLPSPPSGLPSPAALAPCDDAWLLLSGGPTGLQRATALPLAPAPQQATWGALAGAGGLAGGLAARRDKVARELQDLLLQAQAESRAAAAAMAAAVQADAAANEAVDLFAAFARMMDVPQPGGAAGGAPAPPLLSFRSCDSAASHDAAGLSSQSLAFNWAASASLFSSASSDCGGLLAPAFVGDLPASWLRYPGSSVN
jgi:hypothetical protein